MTGLVLVLGSREEELLKRLPRPLASLRVDTAEECLEAIRRDRPLALVLDGRVVGDVFSVARLVREASAVGAATCVIAPPPGLRAIEQAITFFGDEAATVIPRLLRYLAGERLRLSPRVPFDEAVRMSLPGGATTAARAVDLSESGILIYLEGGGAPADARVLLRLADGGVVELEARHVRDGDRNGRCLHAYEFCDVNAVARARLRTLVGAQDQVVGASRGRMGPVRVRLKRPLVGVSVYYRELYERVAKIAATNENVLVTGETGTGKELVVQALHELSRRAHGPFVAVNCAALPADLVESELFGHEAGAFTGATRRRVGRLEQASGGTLFLDEIGELPGCVQAKLLRAVQEWTFERVGGSEPVHVDVRLVAATNRDLDREVAQNQFRRDLLFRLNVIGLPLTPLREHPEDVLPLVEHFLERAQERMGRAPVRLSEAAAHALVQYDWPGNIREVENLCTRAVAFAEDGEVITPDLLGVVPREEPPQAPLPAAELREIVAYCEREIVRRVLLEKKGNRTHAAQALGISRQALQQKLKGARRAAGAAAAVTAPRSDDSLRRRRC
jgi:DNA-binding NtrC family response regulator